MTPARCHIKGTTYMVTRRCVQREFLLRPSKFLNDVFRFVIAHAAETYGIQVHVVCVMSNHFHLIVTDLYGDLSDFMRWINAILARLLNGYHGRWESFFVGGSYDEVELVDADAVLEKIAYVLTNPVEAGLVAYGAQWPGVRLCPKRLGRPEECERPRFFFRKNGPVRPTATLELVKPPAFSDISDEKYIRRVEEAVAKREAAIREYFASSNRTFLGAKKVLAQSIHTRPETHAPRRKLNPRIACRDKWRRIFALQARKRFLRDYRVALKKFCARMKSGSADALDVIFPTGTVGMRKRYGVRCAPAPS
jgi:REP element-mobilizing transposase RayT